VTVRAVGEENVMEQSEMRVVLARVLNVNEDQCMEDWFLAFNSALV